ncbi:hypothetical protein ACE1ET_04995 [Saccharicrinis sp. FJH62]|uniref:hypothetical protein n=1 Tax=Saccharicrinis sp. FJH62 TaxID=3344657 RepID=UPI0035D414D6
MKTLKFLALIFILTAGTCKGPDKVTEPKLADKPLYRDTIFDGAADPSVIWNRETKSWYMFYTNRRATLAHGNDVSWVHGTPIGIAESKDGGASWHYVADADFKSDKDSITYWAPEVVWHNGLYHMFITLVPGIFTNWSHPRHIDHYTSKDLLHWDFDSQLKLATDKVIDACVVQLSDGTWRMWYNNEKAGKSIWYADSPDLYNWTDKGLITLNGKQRGEGPNVFKWKGEYYMVVDEWRGLGVFKSDDALNWTRQPNRILDVPGTGKEDQVIGQHADVVVNNDRAYIFYFTHPGRNSPGGSDHEKARSLIQVAELETDEDGNIICDRNKPVYINMTEPK